MLLEVKVAFVHHDMIDSALLVLAGVELGLAKLNEAPGEPAKELVKEPPERGTTSTISVSKSRPLVPIAQLRRDFRFDVCEASGLRRPPEFLELMLRSAAATASAPSRELVWLPVEEFILVIRAAMPLPLDA
eukprot:CAMPEP_0194760120 /NCGR_PEP_ID=MMETSP0323_2-20130528/13079_1 /TAXON_ID=2866 ORGANISM="Crypthecodinium cohnii, Strain Seligo" /NCGR_SAMPLE_ID=MMETSP0323_2 /ASSEMBLY_ACC=CAM_ASM_000346 /LENGTH=131 /DNA_ID=CAMNT_0039681225 /DNA_START=61 /DNA_END=453 /DNA_ORIENTATION=+